jgi:hypothetical protein
VGHDGLEGPGVPERQLPRAAAHVVLHFCKTWSFFWVIFSFLGSKIGVRKEESLNRRSEGKSNQLWLRWARVSFAEMTDGYRSCTLETPESSAAYVLRLVAGSWQAQVCRRSP